MRRCDDAHLDAHGTFAADANHFVVLHDAKQADLRGGGEFADFVEEQSPAVSLLEPPFSSSHGAREGTSLMAEEFGVDQLGRDRAAVHAPERAASARGMFVERARNDLFARSRLAE